MSEKQEKLARREFLKTTGKFLTGAALAASGLGPLGHGVACAANEDDDLDKYDFIMPRVKFECDKRVPAHWNAYPGADRNLLLEFSHVVRCKVKVPQGCQDMSPDPGQEHHFNVVVDLTDLEQLRKYPFLFMTAEGYYTLSEKKKENLKQYIHGGGFLLMDDCVYQRGGDFFYKSSHELLEDVFGSDLVKRVPNEHEIFHNVYDLGKIGLPYLQGVDHGARGVFVGDRLAVFLSSTDIHCGWAGCWKKRSREYRESIKMGINIIMYAISH